MLNSQLNFSNADTTVQNAFTGRRAVKTPMMAGTRLFKYSDRPLLRPDGSISPWWAFVEPTNAADPGLSGGQARAEGLGATPAEFARARFAVTHQWSSMNDLIVIELIAPVYGFYGQCAGQRLDADDAKVVFIGGGWQVWIPNLTTAYARMV